MMHTNTISNFPFSIISWFHVLLVCGLVGLSGQQVWSQACSGTLGDPIVNQTFGSGPNPGPSIGSLTTYTYVAGTCPGDGYYAIVNTTGCNGAWHTTTDHTGNPNGYMMLVNASFTAGQFYSQTITGLCGNTTYEFSSWVINLLTPPSCTGNPNRFPNITFRIETTTGTLLKSFSTGNVPSTTTPTWNRYATFFTTTAGTSTVVLKLINNAPGGCGNDLALDDIQFRPCGPSLTISGGSSPICLGQSVNLTSTLSGGYNSPMYQWQESSDNSTWTDIVGASNATLTTIPAAAGTRYYRLLASEAGNIANSKCRIASNSISVVVKSLPAAPGVSDVNYCQNSPTTSLTATGTSLLWYTSATSGTGSATAPTPPASTVGTTTYYVSQRVNGCEGPRTAINVVINPVPTLVLSVSTVGCSAGSAGSLVATTAGGTPGYVYSLNGGAAVSTGAFNNLAAGTYTVAAIDTKGCSATATANIPAPNPLSLLLQVGTNCNLTGNNGRITAQAGGGTPGSGYQFSLDGGALQTSSTFDNLTAGQHTVSVQDANGCVLSTTATVPAVQPLSVSVSSSSSCIAAGQGDITLLASNGTLAYEFQLNGGSYQSGSTFSGLSAGTYNFTVRDSRGCTASTTATINAKPAPPIATNPQNVCQGATGVTLTATGTGLLWYTTATGGTGQSSQVVSTTSPGTTAYYVSQTQNGCESDRTEVFATVNPTATLSLTAIPPCNAASNGQILVDATGGSPAYQFALNGSAGQESSVFTGLGTGNYTVTATDAKGCVTTSSIMVPGQVNMSLSVSGNATCILAGQGQIDAIVSGGTGPWDFKLGVDNFISNGNTNSKTYSSVNPGAYIVTARDATGCTASASISFGATPAAAASGGCSGTSPNAIINLVAADAGDGAIYNWSGPLNYTATTSATSTSLAYTSTTQNGTYTLSVTQNGCTATSTVNIQCNIPLPVTLMSFVGRQVEKTVTLGWTTSQESKASHFEILHSTDALAFEAVGRVSAQGSSSNLVNYGWIDNAPAQGLNYYRLRMVDLDGSSELSRIVSVRFSDTNKTFVVVNPAEADGRVLVITDVADPQFSFSDQTGRSVSTSLLEHSQNRYWLRVNRPVDLRMGVLRVQSKEGVYTQKVLFP